MKKSEILYKAVTEHLIIRKSERCSRNRQYYLCLAVAVAHPTTHESHDVRDTIEIDVRANGDTCGFGFREWDMKRDQMQVAMYGLFLTEWFKDTEC